MPVSKKKKIDPARNVILKNVIISYPNLVTAVEDDKGVKKFGAMFITTPQTNIADLQAAETAAAKDFFGAETAAEMQDDGSLKSTWRRSKADQKKVGSPTGYINARSTKRPGVVDRAAKPILDVEEEVYPGCLVNVSLFAFGYENSGNTGITFGLNNVQKVKDGTRLDGRKAAEEEFDAMLDEEMPEELPV